MNSDQNGSTAALASAVAELTERVRAIFSGQADADVAGLLENTDFEPLDEAAARRFYTKILSAIHEYEEGPLDDEARSRLTDAIRREVDELVALRDRRASASEPNWTSEQVELVSRDGLAVRPVVPPPDFNGVHVPLVEGFADLLSLRLWADNARAELYVKEFADRHDGRAPDARELLRLMTGEIQLPGATKLPGGTKADPFNLRPLARSIARKGVERPLIVGWDGTILDGNRRFSASMLVVGDPRTYNAAERERARWVRVWRLEKNASLNQKDAIVVARNFEPELKEPWPEFVKARRVVDAYREAREDQTHSGKRLTVNETKDEVAKRFAITRGEVTRYMKMVRWADDFIDYNVGKDRDAGEVHHRTNKIFQWFYEIDAGRKAHEKITSKFEADETVREIVHDLMFDVLDSGAQVRALHQVYGDEAAWEKLVKAHAAWKADRDGNRDEALSDIEDAIAEAQSRLRAKARAKSGFDEFLRTLVDRLGNATPDDWEKVEEPELLRSVHRVCRAAIGTVEGALGVTEAERDQV